MAKRRPSKEIINLIGHGIPTKQSKTSSYQEKTDSQHDNQASFDDSGFFERNSQENVQPRELGTSTGNNNMSPLTDCRDETFSNDSDNRYEENLPEECWPIRVDEDSNETLIVEASSIAEVNQRHFAENVQYCPITIGIDAARQQKNEKKRGKEKGLSAEDEEHILKQTCALLNSGGGVLVMKITDLQSASTSANALDKFWQKIEPKLIDLIKPSRYDVIFDRCERSDEILLFINAPPHICTIKYNLSLPGDSSVFEASYHETVRLLKETQQGRRRKLPNVTVPLTELPAVPEVFTQRKILLDLKESKQIQLKQFSSKTFLDSNNRSHREHIRKQISAFANADGGVILLGVKDNGEVCGLDLGENGKECIERNLQEKIINKMCWSLDPVRGIHWDLKFFPVVGCEANAVVVIYVAGMRRSGGVFAKSPKSFKLLPGEDGQQSPHLIDFEEWKRRMLSTEGLQSDSRATQDLLSRFQTMRISKGHLLTVKRDVQRIKDAFFIGRLEFPVFPEGFESTLSTEALSVIHKIQKKCSGDRNRGLLVASRSWLENTGGTAMEGVICDLLLVSRNFGGLHLFTLCHGATDDRFLQYSRDTARSIKISLVKDGACNEKFYVSNHVVSCTEDSVIELESRDGRYPKRYDLDSSREKLNEVLKSMIIILASVPSTLSSKLGVSIMNLLTREQFQLVHQQIEINRELWIKGVAGTGKTLVAVEFMRELHRREKLQKSEILCVCENEGIANQIRESDVCHVVCRQTFMWVQFRDVKHVVMDEVHNYEQPIGTESWHQKARQLVRQHDPDQPGYLWFFIDKCQSNHTFPTGIPPESQQKPEFTLKKVIRNSKKIFSHSKKFVPDNDVRNSLEMGHDFEGENVQVISYSRSAKSQMDVVKETRDRLLNDGYREGDIAFLFKKQACIPCLSFSFKSATENSSESIIVSTVLKYSGLERPVVVLVDVDDGIIKGRKKVPFIYGAVTRGMVKLVIVRCKN